MTTGDGLYDDDAQPEWHSERRRRHDWTTDPDRLLALTVRCRFCSAPVGVVCRNRGFKQATPFSEAPELGHMPAHPIRVSDAKRGPIPLDPEVPNG